MSTMSPGVDIGAGDRLSSALAWCRWFERTGGWPVASDVPSPRMGGVGAQVRPARGRLMQCTVEPASARMSPAGISRVVLEAPNE